MAITLVQSNGSASTGTLNATPPAWGVSPTAGNLLVVIGCEVNGTNNTWPTAPAGYTAMPSTPFIHYAAGITGVHGGYAKIAAGGDATPGNFGETSGTQDWVTYTYEFAVPGGWLSATVDKEAHTVASSTQQVTKAAVALAALTQAVELALVIDAHDVAVTAESFAASVFASAIPTTNNGKLRAGWLETASAAAGLTTTASWTTSARAGIKLVTFRTAGAAVSLRPKQNVVRRVGSWS